MPANGKVTLSKKDGLHLISPSASSMDKKWRMAAHPA
jgi:hypothetical protein